MPESTAKEAPAKNTPDEDVPAPDAESPAALRWGRFVIKHFAPEPGSVIMVKYPRNDYGTKKGRKMADTLDQVLDAQDVEGVLIIDTPAGYFDVTYLPESEMNDAGWFRHPPESEDTDT